MNKRLSNRGITIVELLITISVASIVITMLMSILSTTMLTKNKADYENRLLDESYFISEYIQNRVFELGVRSIDRIESDTPEDQILELRHEYDIAQSQESGVIFRDYSNAESYILFYDSVNKSLHYGSADQFDFNNYEFINPGDTRINNEKVEVQSITNIDYTCISEGQFYDGDYDPNDNPDEYENVTRCDSAIIEINITLTYIINNNPLFDPMSFESTIVF